MSINQSLTVLTVQFLFQFFAGLVHTNLTASLVFHVKFPQV